MTSLFVPGVLQAPRVSSGDQAQDRPARVTWLGAVSGAPRIVLIHGGESTVPKLEAALQGSEAVAIYREGLSSGYSEVTGLAKEYPTLRGLLAKYVPGWAPGTPLVVLGYSAGGWALRYYLRDVQARGDVTAAIFLDSLYGAPGNVCDLSPYQGVIAYGKEANASPGTKRLVMTYSQAHPAPGICSQAVQKAVGAGSGVIVQGYANADHGAQQGVAGPAAVKDHVAPWIGRGSGVSSTKSSAWWPWAAAAGLLGAAAFWKWGTP